MLGGGIVLTFARWEFFFFFFFTLSAFETTFYLSSMADVTCQIYTSKDSAHRQSTVLFQIYCFDISQWPLS